MSYPEPQLHQCDLCEYWGRVETLTCCGSLYLCPRCAEDYEQEQLDAEYDREIYDDEEAA